jgi:hypothetical protein
MKKNLLSVVTNKIVRRSLVKNPFFANDSYVLTEYPKSGGSWIGGIFAGYLNLPFPRNEIPKNVRSLLHGHYLPHQINTICKKNLPLVVYRDPRDIIVSWYFHSYFINERFNERHVKRMKKRLSFDDYDDVENNLPEFINFVLNQKYPLGFNWIDFVDNWSNVQHTAIKYEDMLQDPIKTMSNVLSSYTNFDINEGKLRDIVSRFSFKSQSGREPGSIKKSSFVRKGISGDWMNYFNSESTEICNDFFGNYLHGKNYTIESNGNIKTVLN